MDCQGCREAISAGLDGESDRRETRAVELHIAGCPACRMFVERAASITRLARTGLVTPGPDLVGPLLVRLGLPGDHAEAKPALSHADVESPVSPRLAKTAGLPATPCGCSASCRCGCQSGAPCRCTGRVA